jgi:uncharacterized membrane protein
VAPTLAVVLAWLLFGTTHLGLADPRLRDPLVARIGERGFLALYSLVAAATFALLVHTYAVRRFAGGAGPGLADVPVVRMALMVLIGAGVVILAAGLVAYPASAMALFTTDTRPPRGVERVTRHPFFVGLAVLAIAHALLARHLTGTAFFTGLAVFTLVGARLQDAKLLARRGAPYAAYLRGTSVVPFAAILAGRQGLAWQEIRPAALAIGLGVAVALRAVHPAILDHGGLWVTGAVLGGAALAAFQSWRRAQRLATRRLAAATPR